MATLPRVQNLNFQPALQAFEQGREGRIKRDQQNALSEFGQGAFAGDQNALAQLFQTNPNAAIALGQIADQRQNALTAQEQRAEDLAFRRDQGAQDRAFQREQFDFQKERFNIERARKAQELAFKIDQAGRQPQGNPKRAQDLRKEFTQLSKDYLKVRDAFGRIRAVGTTADPTGADDMALIFNFMKVLDPGSTVREGEFATAENTGGVDDKVRNIYNKILNGERLTDEQRGNFVGSATRLFTQQDAQQQRLFDTFERLAEKEGIDPNDVAIELGLVPDPAATAPPVTPEPMQPGEQQTFGDVTIRRIN